MQGVSGSRPMEVVCRFNSSSLLYGEVDPCNSNQVGAPLDPGVDATLELTLDPAEDPSCVVNHLAEAEGLPPAFARTLNALLSEVVEEKERLEPSSAGKSHGSLRTGHALSHSAANAGDAKGDEAAPSVLESWRLLVASGRVPAPSSHFPPRPRPAHVLQQQHEALVAGERDESLFSLPASSQQQQKQRGARWGQPVSASPAGPNAHLWATAFLSAMSTVEEQEMIFQMEQSMASRVRRMFDLMEIDLSQLQQRQAAEMDAACRLRTQRAGGLTSLGGDTVNLAALNAATGAAAATGKGALASAARPSKPGLTADGRPKRDAFFDGEDDDGLGSESEDDEDDDDDDDDGDDGVGEGVARRTKGATGSGRDASGTGKGTDADDDEDDDGGDVLDKLVYKHVGETEALQMRWQQALEAMRAQQRQDYRRLVLQIAQNNAAMSAHQGQGTAPSGHGGASTAATGTATATPAASGVAAAAVAAGLPLLMAPTVSLVSLRPQAVSALHGPAAATSSAPAAGSAAASSPTSAAGGVGNAAPAIGPRLSAFLGRSGVDAFSAHASSAAASAAPAVAAGAGAGAPERAGGASGSTVLAAKMVYLGGSRKVPFLVKLEFGDVDGMCLRDWGFLAHGRTAESEADADIDVAAVLRKTSPDLASAADAITAKAHAIRRASSSQGSSSSGATAAAAAAAGGAAGSAEVRRMRRHVEALYEDELTAVVLPQDVESLLGRGAGKPLADTSSSSSVKAFDRACQASAELHFPSITDQLQSAAALLLRSAPPAAASAAPSPAASPDVGEDGEGEGEEGEEQAVGAGKRASQMTLGDSVVTLHSNLREAHVVFHLASMPYFAVDKAGSSSSLASQYVFSSAAAAASGSSAASAAGGAGAEMDSGAPGGAPTGPAPPSPSPSTTSTSPAPQAYDTVLSGLRHVVLLSDLYRVKALGVPVSLAVHSDVVHQLAHNALMHYTSPSGAGAGAGGELLGSRLPAELALQVEGALRAVKHSLSVLASSITDADRSLREVRFLLPLTSAQLPTAASAARTQEPDYAPLHQLALVQQCLTLFNSVYT